VTGKVSYHSRVRIERAQGSLRRALLPAEDEPILFGVHDEVADHYGVPHGGPKRHMRPRSTTWSLEARQVPAGEGRLTGEAAGEIETEDGVLVIKRIHVRFTLAVDPDADREKIARAFAHYKPRCPVYRSISGSIAISDEPELDAPLESLIGRRWRV
jgi:hypothetical protein